MGIDRTEIQRRNLLAEGDTFPYGMKAQQGHARRSFAETERRFDVTALRSEIDRHNRDNRLTKRGLAMMPVCFGISFTSAYLNQAAALVHVYTDGSVSVSTGAVEMGQGVNAKMLNVAAHALGIEVGRITVETTNTLRVANTSPNVAAEILEVDADRVAIRAETVTVDGKTTQVGWNRLVTDAYFKRVSLSAQAHYATPKIHFDREAEKGEPFAYHVYGSAVIETTVDCLRGTYTVDRVGIVHDAGRSLNPLVDMGQLEGGLVQGIGWMTMEEMLFSNGRNLTDTLSTYKIPDILCTPEIEGHFLEDADNPNAVMRSKAIGEPPLMYGIGAYFALLDALRAFRPDREAFFHAPMTPERVLMFLHGDRQFASTDDIAEAAAVIQR
jgi:xanthine dehydrogenase large subunit